jgi:uncharacterized membrane protein YbhN (UPF0104 family)
MPQIRFISQVWISRIQAAVVGAILGSIISVIIKLWSQLQTIQWHFEWRLLFISIFLVIATVIEWAIVWSWMVQKMSDKPASLHQIINIYMYGNLSKYLPGSVWNYVARGYLGHKRGIGIRRVGFASIIEIIVSIATGLLLYAGSLMWPQTRQPFLSQRILFILFLFLILAISPPVVQHLDPIITKIRKPKVTKGSSIKLNWLHFAIYNLLSWQVWLVIGIAFFFLAMSIYPFSLHDMPEVIGGFSFSIVIGLIAIGIPQGLGVREGILTLSLQALVPLPVAISISLFSRFWLVLCELFATLLWWGFDRFSPEYYERIIDL